MANSVTKDEVKAFVKAVRIEMDARNAAKFAPNVTVSNVKSELGDLKEEVAQINTDNFVEKEDGKVLSSNDFTTEEKETLARLAKESNDTFDASDVLDIFSD